MSENQYIVPGGGRPVFYLVDNMYIGRRFFGAVSGNTNGVQWITLEFANRVISTITELRAEPDFAHVPPNDNPRAPDGFSYENEYSANARRICYTASPTDNGDVMIALLSDGVVDSNCIKVLRSIATGKNAGIAELNRLRDELPTEILRASIKQPDYYDLTDESDADYASPS
ncbi:hypothetical protein C8R42DRAFT_777936 [Lentinula raphanica]|nr:hypothetical protein C8R42DRAFT_777936 [Lentinula raphanica]